MVAVDNCSADTLKGREIREGIISSPQTKRVPRMPAARDCPEGLDPQKTLNKLLHSSRAYKSASVLSLYWEDDEMGCINEVEKINTLFKKEFGYDVDRFGIPTQSPYWGLNAKISEFVRVRNKPDSLLIIYYGGHGVSDMKEGRYGSVWAA